MTVRWRVSEEGRRKPVGLDDERELVTNAIIHAEAGCELRVLLDRGMLTTTVRDGGSALVVDLSRAAVEPLAVHGRALQIVSTRSTRWGSELDAEGLTVWFVPDQA